MMNDRPHARRRRRLLLVPALLPPLILTLLAYSQLFWEQEGDGGGRPARYYGDTTSDDGTDRYAHPYPMTNLSSDFGFLWDDMANLASNPHVVGGLTSANVLWAVRDGVVLGVYEPVSNVIKMGIHSVAHAAAAAAFVSSSGGGLSLGGGTQGGGVGGNNDNREVGEEEEEGAAAAEAGALSPRAYRLINLAVHMINVVLSLFVMGAFVDQTVVGVPNPDDGHCGHSDDADDAAGRVRIVRIRELSVTLGLVVGTCWYAVHPLHVQVVGWASCLPYELSALFGLLSFGAYVRHKGDAMQRRWHREEEGGDAAAIRSHRRGGGSLFRIELARIVSVACYAAASFCKAPAVVLPAVFLVVDVYAYDSDNDDIDGERGRDNAPPDLPMHPLPWHAVFLPHLIVCRLATHSLPKLSRRAVSSLRTTLAPYFLASIFVSYGLLRGTHDYDPHDDDDGRLSAPELAVRVTRALCWYVRKVVAPTDLMALVEAEAFSFQCLISPLSLLAVPYLVLVVLTDSLETQARRAMACSVGAAMGLLFPSLGLFVQHSQKMMVAADRYMYLPLLVSGPASAASAAGWCSVALGGGPSRSSGPGRSGRKRRRRADEVFASRAADKARASVLAPLILLPALLGVLAFATLFVPFELYHWRNSQLLWTRNVNLNPRCGTCHSNLVKEYMHYDRDLRKAEVHARAAVDIFNGTKMEYRNTLSLARCLYLRGRFEESKSILRDLMTSSSRRTSSAVDDKHNSMKGAAHYLHALILVKTGGLDGALDHMAKSARYGHSLAKKELPRLEGDAKFLRERGLLKGAAARVGGRAASMQEAGGGSGEIRHGQRDIEKNGPSRTEL